MQVRASDEHRIAGGARGTGSLPVVSLAHFFSKPGPQATRPTVSVPFQCEQCYCSATLIKYKIKSNQIMLNRIELN